MTVSFSLPKPVRDVAGAAAPVSDARDQMARLYRDIGISAVASALHMQNLASVEEREAAGRARCDAPACLRDDDLAA